MGWIFDYENVCMFRKTTLHVLMLTVKKKLLLGYKKDWIWYVLAESQYMAYRKCLSVASVRLDMLVSIRGRYDGHTLARVDFEPAKKM